MIAEITTARRAMCRPCAVVPSLVKATNTGISEIGSTTTKKTTKNLSNC
jgi:hypothetical protein